MMQSPDHQNMHVSCLVDTDESMENETNPIFAAVTTDDFAQFKNLVDTGDSINVLNSEGNSLLTVVMQQKRVEMFNYLLSNPQIDVNILNTFQETPLFFLVKDSFDEYFANELVKKGADVNKPNLTGWTLLHLVAEPYDEKLHIFEFLIEMGADINTKEPFFGRTLLYKACEVGSFDLACMLLYYGADATICNKLGCLPVAVISEKFQPEVIAFIFDHTFDKYNTRVNLSTFTNAMMRNTGVFCEILQHVTRVEYSIESIEDFVESLPDMYLHYFKMFLDEFGGVIKKMFGTFLVLDDFVCTTLDDYHLKRILEIFLESDYVDAFVQSQKIIDSMVSLLLQELNNTLSEEEFTKIICIMLSYGLPVTSRDLDSVYKNYGYCDLFRILLHMDVIILSSEEPLMAALFYNPHANIDSLDLNVSLCVDLLEYYNHTRLKNFIQSNSNDNELIEKVGKVPGVPLLLELSRNVARKYILDKFNIQTSRQFNTVLQRLPIGEMNKDILSLRKKLY